MRRQRGKSVFRRYLLTYSMVFCIPFILFFMLFNTYFIRVYKEDVILNHQERSSRTGLMLDWQLKQLNSVAIQMLSSNVYRPGAAMSTSYQLTMMRNLNTIISANELIYSINYYQKNLDWIITNENVIRRETFSQFYFHYLNWAPQEMLEDMHSLRQQSWRSFEPVQIRAKEVLELMTFSIPLNSSQIYNAQSVQIQVEKSVFERMLGIDDEQQSTFFILDEDGKVFYQSGPAEEGLLEAMDMNLNTALTARSGESVTLEVGNYLFCGMASTENGWYYLNAMPLGIALAKIRGFQLTFLVFAAVVFALCVLVAYLVSRTSYKPVGELWEVLQKSNIPMEGGGDEIGKAKQTISYLSQFSFTLEQQLVKSSTQVREAMAQGLLKGKYRTVDEFNEEGLPYGISLTGQLFFVVIAAEEGERSLSLGELERFIGTAHGAIGVESFDASHSVFVCSAAHGPKDRVYEDFVVLAETVRQDTSIRVALGISTLTTDLSLLYSKYIEAMSALEYNDTSRSPVAIYGYGRDLSAYSMRYPNDEIEILRQSLRDANETRFQTAFQMLLSYVENQELPLFMRICVCFDAINAMLKDLMDMKEDAATNDFFLQLSNQLIGRQNDFSWYVRTLKLLRDHITMRLSTRAAGADQNLESIREYIHLHYLEEDFSVQRLADQFSLNISNLSIYFKEKTNSTLTQYITALKMNYAVELLKAGEYSLADIARITGYSTASSFIRKFKQYTGTTPGEYKKMHEEQ